MGRKYYLSSTDDGAKNWGMGYFLVQLPKPVKTVDEAYKILQPKEINDETPYIRQGEYFFVPTKYTTNDLKKRNPKISRPKYIEEAEYFIYDNESWQYSSLDEWRKIVERKIKSIMKHHYKVRIWWSENRRNAHIKYKILVSPVMKGVIYKNRNIAGVIHRGNSGNPHNARDMIIFPGKEVYVRGTIRHPEHKMINLGEVWHRVYINRAVTSFTASGRID